MLAMRVMCVYLFKQSWIIFNLSNKRHCVGLDLNDAVRTLNIVSEQIINKLIGHLTMNKL